MLAAFTLGVRTTAGALVVLTGALLAILLTWCGYRIALAAG